MNDHATPQTLAEHLSHLQLDIDDIVALLAQKHDGGGDIHPEALGKAERLQTSLAAVIDALTHHEHLEMTADNVWAALTVEHANIPDQIN